MKQAIKSVLYAALGAVVGTGTGLGATYALVKVCVALSPNDPSAASAGDAALLLVPIGLVCGACVGAARSRKKLA